MKKFDVEITLTWSKAVAVIILIMAFILEFKYGAEGKIFMISLPAIVVLITGKQYLDKKNEDQRIS